MKGFTEEEARQVFARAAERQHAVEARGEELSLDELQTIGAEAGLDPAHVVAAAAELRAGPSAEPVVVGGIDTAPRQSRVLSGEVSDETWEQMVLQLRRTFGTSGVPSGFGRVREWASGPNSNLRVLVEPAEGGTRVSLQTRRDDAASLLWLAPGMGGGLAALFLALGLGGGKLDEPAAWLFIGAFLVFAAVAGLWGRRALSRWSDTRHDQFESLLDQFERLQGAASAPGVEAVDAAPEASEAASGRLDLDALPDAPEAGGRGESRGRVHG